MTTRKQNYEEALSETRKMSKAEIRKELKQSQAYHEWYVDALFKALQEKQKN